MAIDMSTVTTITLDNQDVTKIEDSLGNVLWQKGSTPTTDVIDKFPDATNDILTLDGGPISDYTTILNPTLDNEATRNYPVTIDGETYPIRIKLYGTNTTNFQTLLQISVASNSTVYLICSSTSGTARTIFIDDVITSYLTPVYGSTDKLALPMTSGVHTSGVHTIGFSGNAHIWGIIGDLNTQNSQ